jgi:hypothetical protein
MAVLQTFGERHHVISPSNSPRNLDYSEGCGDRSKFVAMLPRSFIAEAHLGILPPSQTLQSSFGDRFWSSHFVIFRRDIPEVFHTSPFVANNSSVKTFAPADQDMTSLSRSGITDGRMANRISSREHPAEDRGMLLYSCSRVSHHREYRDSFTTNETYATSKTFAELPVSIWCPCRRPLF